MRFDTVPSNRQFSLVGCFTDAWGQVWVKMWDPVGATLWCFLLCWGLCFN